MGPASSPDQPRKIADRALGGLLWSFTGTASQAGLQLLVLTILARLIDPAEFGVIGAALIVIGFADMFARLGIGQALVQRASLDDEHVAAALLLSLVASVILASLVAATAPVVATFFSMPRLVPLLRALAACFVVNGFAAISQALLQREMRFRDLAQVQVLSYSVGYGIGGVALALAGLGAWALAGAYLMQAITRAVLSFRKAPHSLQPRASRQACRDILSYGGGFTLGRIANYAALQGDNIVVGRTLGASALGIYGRAYQLMVMPVVLLGQVLDSVLFPAMAEVKDDPATLAKAYLRTTTAVTLLAAPICAAMIILAPEVVRVILGPRWAMVVPPLRVLAIGILFRAEYKISDSLAHATGTVYQRAWRQAAYAVLVIVGASVGQHYAGLTGVAAAVLIAIIAVYLLMVHLSITTIRLRWGAVWSSHIPALCVFTIVALGLMPIAAVLRTIGSPNIIVLLTAMLYTGLACFALYRFSPRSSPVVIDIEWVASRLRTRFGSALLPALRSVRERSRANS